MWICVTAYRGYRVRKDYRQSRQWTGWVRGVFIVFVSFVCYYSVFLHDCVFRYLFVLYSRSPADRPSDVVLECAIIEFTFPKSQFLGDNPLAHTVQNVVGLKKIGLSSFVLFWFFIFLFLFFRNDTQSCTDFHSSRCKRMCTRHFLKHIF